MTRSRSGGKNPPSTPNCKPEAASSKTAGHEHSRETASVVITQGCSYKRGVFPATLFDFNGVLVDDEHVHLEAFRDTLSPLGIELQEQAYWDKYLGFDDLGAFEAIFHDCGRSATRTELERLVEAKRPHYMARARRGLQVFEGAADVVRRAAQAGPAAVVSGALTAEIEFGLEHLGVADCIGHIVSAEHTKKSKPDPEGYLLGVAWLSERIGDRAAHNALVIEDSPDGIAAAKSLGLPTIAVAHSYPEDKLRQTPCDWVVSHVRELTSERLAEFARAWER